MDKSYKIKIARPGVGIGIKIFNKDNKVLIGQRVKEGLFGYPGGHLEMFESWEHCAQRELKEETGITLPLKAFKSAEVMNVIHPQSGYHYINITMLALMPEDQKPQNKEQNKCKKWLWLSSEELLKLGNKLFHPILLDVKTNPGNFADNFGAVISKLK